MEGKIALSARRQVTNKLRSAYRGASRVDKGRILDQAQASTGVGRSTARMLLAGPHLPDPSGQIDRRSVRPRRYGDDARELLIHVWALMGLPCGKYLKVMLEQWLPALAAAGELDQPFATQDAINEVSSMSAATIDRYLRPVREGIEIKGKAATKPSPLLRNSITIRKAGRAGTGARDDRS